MSLRKNPRALSTFLYLAGLLLWSGGVIAALCGRIEAGATLRTSAIALLGLGNVARRPSFVVWTLWATLAGVELGADAPHIALELRFFVDLFLRLIRMIIAPLLLSTITVGIAQHSKLGAVGRMAAKSLIFFEVATTLGLIFGAVATALAGVGWGVALPATTTLPPTEAVHTWQQTLVNLFPENIAQAIAQNQVLQVAVFGLLVGIAMAQLPQEKREPLLKVLQSIADTIFQMTRLIMYLAPLAAGSAIAYTVASCGIGSLLPLARLAGVCYGSLLLFTLTVLLPTLLFFRVPIRAFIKAVAEPAAIGFATTTSEAALPLAIERMEEFGIPRSIVTFVIPMGYSFNLIGSSIYIAVTAVFTAQAGGIHLTLMQYVTMLATLMLASKGVAGVPRAVIVVLLATAGSLQLPIAPIMLLLGIDALMDMGRTALNVVGNCMAAAIVASSEGELKRSTTSA